jgi:hypothetical protein
MKIAYMSDLHIEFLFNQTRVRDYEWDGYTYLPCGPKLEPFKNLGIDVFVLAGDIGDYRQHYGYAEELSRYLNCDVVSVLGNHEWYGETFYQPRLPNGFSIGERHHLLNRDGVIINGVRFLGCTLWTDFNATWRQGFVMQHVARFALSDFTYIKGMSPELMLGEHQKDCEFLLTTLNGGFDGETVVVTHNSPLTAMRNPNFPMDDHSACFVTDRIELLEAAGANSAYTWVYGHDHWSREPSNYYGVDIMSAQRGYAGENSNWKGPQVYEH